MSLALFPPTCFNACVCMYSVYLCVCVCCAERNDCRHKIEELSTQVQSLMDQNRSLQIENEELPQLRDTVEEMKYLESKVVR